MGGREGGRGVTRGPWEVVTGREAECQEEGPDLKGRGGREAGWRPPHGSQWCPRTASSGVPWGPVANGPTQVREGPGPRGADTIPGTLTDTGDSWGKPCPPGAA